MIEDMSEGFLGFPREPKKEVLSCLKCDFKTEHNHELNEHLLVFHDINEDQGNKFEIIEEKIKKKRIVAPVAFYDIQEEIFQDVVHHGRVGNQYKNAGEKKPNETVPALNIKENKGYIFQDVKEKLKKNIRIQASGASASRGFFSKSTDSINKVPRAKLIIKKVEPRFQITNEVIEDDHKPKQVTPQIIKSVHTRKRGRLLPNGERLHCCRSCSYTTTIKSELPKHRFTAHSDSIIYRCSQCPYETRRKNDMPKHMLGHCDNVPMYQCANCPYKTKRKCDLPKHELCHKSTDSVNLYKCQFCPYVSKRKGDLAKHMWNHSEQEQCFMTLFNCTECEYVSKRKNDLHKHMLVHCDRHISGVFKCQKCSYASDKVVKFSNHVLSQCKKWDNTVSLDHMRLEDILDSVDEDGYHVVIDGGEEGQVLRKAFDKNDEEEEEFEFVDEMEGEVIEEDQIVGYIEGDESMEGELIEVAEGEIYGEEDGYVTYADTGNGEYVQVQTHGKDTSQGVFKINLGEFAVDVDPNTQEYRAVEGNT